MHIAIAGNIGSGKSTLTTMIAKHLGFQPHYEDPSVNPYLSDFYSDMERWSFKMQIFFLQNRIKNTLEIQKSGNNIVQDRTLYEDAEIFAPNLLSMGLMSKRDFDTYHELYLTVNQLIAPPNLTIFLNGSISTLVEQIQSRGREYEDMIRLDYLKKLNERYEEWFEKFDLGKKLEVNIDELKFRDNPEDFGVILQKINAELYGLFGN